MLPLIQELGPDQCQVLCYKEEMLPRVPAGAERAAWRQVMLFEAPAWRAEFHRCWPQWSRCLRRLCREHRLPQGAFQRLALGLLLASQHVAGFLGFLSRTRPAAVVTEHNRNNIWSCLVLAARKLGIPTFTLIHGMADEKATNYVPFLADRSLCWGELDRAKFLALGEPAEKLLIGGCPRQTRELSATPAVGRAKLGLPPDKPVVMLASGPIGSGEHIKMARLFCEAVERSDRFSAVVRLHPVENLATYADLIRAYPRVRFSLNAEASLDEALAATDIVVSRVSGLGADVAGERPPGDRLRRARLSPGTRGGPDRACRLTAGHDPRRAVGLDRPAPVRRVRGARHHEMAGRFVDKFCAAFGQDASRRSAELVRSNVERQKIA